MSRRKLSEISRETEARLGAKRIVENEIARLTVKLRQFENETIDSLSSEVGIRESVTILALCSQSVSDEDYRDPSAYAYALEILAEGVHGIRTTLHDAGHLSSDDEEADEPVSPPAIVVTPGSTAIVPVAPDPRPSVVPAETPVEQMEDDDRVAAGTRRPADHGPSTFVLHGIVIATQHRDKVDEIVDQAMRDRAAGEKDPQFDNARGKNIWRKKLYDAVFDDAEPALAEPESPPAEETEAFPPPSASAEPTPSVDDVEIPLAVPASFVLSPVAGTDLPLYPRADEDAAMTEVPENLPDLPPGDPKAEEPEPNAGPPPDERTEAVAETPASTDPPPRPKAQLPAFLMTQPRPTPDDWTDPYGSARQRAATQAKEAPPPEPRRDERVQRPNFGLKFPGVKELDLSHLK